MERYIVTAEGKDRLDVLNRLSTLFLQKRLEVENFEFSRTAPQQGEYKITCYSDKQDMIERLVSQINNIVEIRKAYYTI